MPVPPSPFIGRKSLEIPHVKAGFTGEKKDKLGRRRCYANGKLVGCGGAKPAANQQGQGQQSQEQQAKQPKVNVREEKAKQARMEKETREKEARAAIDLAVKTARDIAKNPAGATAEEVKRIGDALLPMNKKELIEFKKELNVKGWGTKADIVGKIKEQALTKAGLPADDYTEDGEIRFADDDFPADEGQQAEQQTPAESVPEQQVKPKLPPDVPQVDAETPIGKLFAADTQGQELVNKFLASVSDADDHYAAVEHLKSKEQELENKLGETIEAGDEDAEEDVEHQLDNVIRDRKELTKKFLAKARSELKKTIKPDEAANILVWEKDTFSGKTPKNIKTASSFLDGMVGDMFNRDMMIGANKLPDDDTREFFRKGEGIFLSDNTSVETIVHELGHSINENYSVKRLCANFLQARLKGEKERRLNKVLPNHGYDNDEYGAKDNFDKVLGKSGGWYAGKTYDDGQTELISLGVQQLYKDPVKFAKKDPEYFQFVTGIISGRLLNVEDSMLPPNAEINKPEELIISDD